MCVAHASDNKELASGFETKQFTGQVNPQYRREGTQLNSQHGSRIGLFPLTLRIFVLNPTEAELHEKVGPSNILGASWALSSILGSRRS